MRRLISIFVFSLLLISCEKEDVFEGVTLAPNKYEISEDRYVTVKNVGQIDCTTIGFDIIIHTELLPKEVKDNLDDFEVRIEDSSGKKLKATRFTDQWVAAKCDTVNEYKVTLYRKSPESETRPYEFQFRTIK